MSEKMADLYNFVSHAKSTGQMWYSQDELEEFIKDDPFLVMETSIDNNHLIIYRKKLNAKIEELPNPNVELSISSFEYALFENQTHEIKPYKITEFNSTKNIKDNSELNKKLSEIGFDKIL